MPGTFFIPFSACYNLGILRLVTRKYFSYYNYIYYPSVIRLNNHVRRCLFRDRQSLYSIAFFKTDWPPLSLFLYIASFRSIAPPLVILAFSHSFGRQALVPFLGSHRVIAELQLSPPSSCLRIKMSATTTITAENVTSLFPDVNRTRLVGADDSQPTQPDGAASHDDLAGYDEEQIRLMDDVCIVLDTDDQAIGTASKKACHLMTNVNAGLLHRAFSVFLFHPTTKKLLLQQRASEKITFPNMWTNTCCSHPLAHAQEIGLGDLPSNADGARRAAQRKLDHELGIPSSQMPVHDFSFLTRIHYLAPSDGKWGEHEIDYILFITADPTLKINENEVQDVKWVTQQELKQLFADAKLAADGKESDKEVLKYTPWFQLICEGMLYEWWDALIEGRLDDFTNQQEIKRMLPE